MYIIYNVYDDNTAEVMELPSMQIKYMTEQELINFNKHNEVLGLDAGKKIYYLHPYSVCLFPSEADAYFYIQNNQLINAVTYDVGEGYYAVVERHNNIKHVDYFVYTCSGIEKLYVGQEKGSYVAYIQSAKVFKKNDAKKLAAIMTRNSKHGKHWFVERIVY